MNDSMPCTLDAGDIHADGQTAQRLRYLYATCPETTLIRANKRDKPGTVSRDNGYCWTGVAG
jgi:hypothetical protein